MSIKSMSVVAKELKFENEQDRIVYQTFVAYSSCLLEVDDYHKTPESICVVDNIGARF